MRLLSIKIYQYIKNYVAHDLMLLLFDSPMQSNNLFLLEFLNHICLTAHCEYHSVPTKLKD